MTRKNMAVVMALVLILLAVVPVVFGKEDPRTYTMIEKVCFTDNPAVSHYAFVDMSRAGVMGSEFNGGTLLVTRLEDGVKEYGYYTAANGYQLLGWGWMVDGEMNYSALEGGGASLEQLTAFMASVQDELRANCTETEVEIIWAI